MFWTLQISVSTFSWLGMHFRIYQLPLPFFHFFSLIPEPKHWINTPYRCQTDQRTNVGWIGGFKTGSVHKRVDPSSSREMQVSKFCYYSCQAFYYPLTSRDSSKVSESNRKSFRIQRWPDPNLTRFFWLRWMRLRPTTAPSFMVSPQALDDGQEFDSLLTVMDDVGLSRISTSPTLRTPEVGGADGPGQVGHPESNIGRISIVFRIFPFVGNFWAPKGQFFANLLEFPEESCSVGQRFSAAEMTLQPSLLQILGLFQFDGEVSLVSSPDHIFVSSKLKDRALNVAVWDTALQTDTAKLEVSDHRALIAQFDAWWISSNLIADNRALLPNGPEFRWCFGRI